MAEPCAQLRFADMSLHQALGIESGQVVAFIGAGGKTTAIWRLMREMDGRVVFTTTTKIMEPVLPPDGALMLSPQPEPARVCALLARASRVVLAAGRLPEIFSPAPEHPVPSLPYKLVGFSPNVLGELIVACACAMAPRPAWLIEADGAKGAGLKIPADHEPVIPSPIRNPQSTIRNRNVGSSMSPRMKCMARSGPRVFSPRPRPTRPIRLTRPARPPATCWCAPTIIPTGCPP